MSVSLSSNDLDPGKWRPVSGSELIFFALFSKSILVIPAKLGRDIARGKGHLVREIELREFDFNRP